MGCGDRSTIVDTQAQAARVHLGPSALAVLPIGDAGRGEHLMRGRSIMVRWGIKSVTGILLSLTLGAALAAAQGTVKIGVIEPLSGNSGGAGKAAKAGVELIADIVNNDHPELA